MGLRVTDPTRGERMLEFSEAYFGLTLKLVKNARIHLSEPVDMGLFWPRERLTKPPQTGPAELSNFIPIGKP